MGFGAFCPMPLRLGGSATEGVTAAQHSRACADLVAMKRTLPFALLTFTQAGSVITVNSFWGAAGIAASYRPTSTVLTTGKSTWAFTPIQTDAYDNRSALSLQHVLACAHYDSAFRFAQAVCFSVTRNSFYVEIENASGTAVDGKASVAVW